MLVSSRRSFLTGPSVTSGSPLILRFVYRADIIEMNTFLIKMLYDIGSKRCKIIVFIRCKNIIPSVFLIESISVFSKIYGGRIHETDNIFYFIIQYSFLEKPLLSFLFLPIVSTIRIHETFSTLTGSRYFAFFALLRRPRTDIKPPARQSDPLRISFVIKFFAEKQFRWRKLRALTLL